jgi:large subunit ribosomal protein L9
MATQVILLERVEKLGVMGDVVTVKPGYARNFLIPQAKALRATKENIAYYEAQKAHLTKLNADKKSAAEKTAKAIEGTKVVLIRQASEGGQLYGSVAARDIAEALSEESKQAISRGMVTLNAAIKTIGVFKVEVVLHSEVKVQISVNIARTAAEAATQEKTGKAVIAEVRGRREETVDAKAAMLEDSALAAEAADAEAAAADEAAAAEKAAKKAAKKAPKADEADSEAAE